MNNLKHIPLKKIFYVFIALLLTGCPLESEYGLPNDEKINNKILGKWGSLESPNEYVLIEKNTATTYKITLPAEDTVQQIIAYSKKINGRHIMNLLHDDGTTNQFHSFKIKGDKLILYEVNRELHKEKFASKAALIAYFENNIKKDSFFINKSTLNRLKQ